MAIEDDVIIEGENVHKIYDTGKVTVHALRGIDLTINRGEMISIMGPSGCGKTTLLNCFSGLDDLTDGLVRIEGVELGGMSDRQKTAHRAKRMGFIFQSYNLLPVLTAVENVELPLIVTGHGLKKAREKATAALDLVDMVEWKGHTPSELSGGQQQRVAIARSLVNDPAIVWADEPTGNLDASNSQQVMKLLCKLNKENNQTFVVVTHDPAVGGMTDRMLFMEDGHIVKERASNSS